MNSNKPNSHEMIYDDHQHSAINRVVAIALDASENAQIALEWGKFS
jgi:hypothetical protein